MNFSIGEEVKIRKKSKYFWQCPNITGRIVEYDPIGDDYGVLFKNEYYNTYWARDLVSLSTKIKEPKLLW